MEYSNRYSLLGLRANFILKLKYVLLLFIRVEIEVAIKCRERFKDDYHVNRLENFIDQVLQFHSRSFTSLLKLTLFL